MKHRLNLNTTLPEQKKWEMGVKGIAWDDTQKRRLA
jgi:hypothetical protein